MRSDYNYDTNINNENTSDDSINTTTNDNDHKVN